MNRLVHSVRAGIVLSLFWALTAVAQSETGRLLDELNLGNAQRAEINAVLMGGMQSLNVINGELFKLENSPAETAKRPEHEQMRQALTERRFQLVQSMAVDILGVLNQEQLSKFDFGHLIKALPKDANNATWEQEI